MAFCIVSTPAETNIFSWLSVRGRLPRGMEGNLEEFSSWAAAMAMSSIARVALLSSVSFLITCVSSIAEEKTFLRFLFSRTDSFASFRILPVLALLVSLALTASTSVSLSFSLVNSAGRSRPPLCMEENLEESSVRNASMAMTIARTRTRTVERKMYFIVVIRNCFCFVIRTNVGDTFAI
eukprot:scaffold421316_cov65-Attheya_sp.AAC.2